MGEVRGQLLAGDRSGFRHTFPEECGGFVPGAGPSPEPRSLRAWGRSSVPLLIFYGHAVSSPVGKLIINVSRLERGNLKMTLAGCRFFFPFFFFWRWQPRFKDIKILQPIF